MTSLARALAGAALSLLCIASARAQVRDLPVPSITIYPNDIISSAQISERKFRTTAASVVGIATDRSEIVGKQARRRLNAGKPIPLSAVAVPMAVKRGARMSASYTEDGLTISTAVIALQDGAAGDVIEARNPNSGLILRGRVETDGSLAVDSE